MSVLVTVKVPGDVDIFTKSVQERGEEFAAIAEQAFIAEVGGDTSVPPEITVTTSIDSADRF